MGSWPKHHLVFLDLMCSDCARGSRLRVIFADRSDDSNLSRLSSNGPRSEFRERKKAYWAVQAPNFEYFKASNLQTVHKAFVQVRRFDLVLC